MSDIAGMDREKRILEQAILLPKLQPQLFVGNRKLWEGILLYGPPGTGRTIRYRALQVV